MLLGPFSDRREDGNEEIYQSTQLYILKFNVFKAALAQLIAQIEEEEKLSTETKLKLIKIIQRGGAMKKIIKNCAMKMKGDYTIHFSLIYLFLSATHILQTNWLSVWLCGGDAAVQIQQT